MAKYKLTVKYNDVCELSLESDISDIIGNEFDQYIKSILYKKEDWENFETNFKEAARLEYGNDGEKEDEFKPVEDEPELTENKPAQEENEPAQEENKSEPAEDNRDYLCGAQVLSENKETFNDTPDDVKEESLAPEENPAQKERQRKILKTLSFADYIKNKNINTPLDEFVAGACYLDEISNIKEFTLKELNAKLYPAFGRLANMEVIENAFARVLIEAVKNGSSTRYRINQNAWNYHNYDLVRH